MSSRLGRGALCTLRGRAHFFADCYRLTRRDSVQMCMTGLDRPIVFRGQTYRPASGSTRSQEVVGAALEVGNMDLAGLISADAIQGNDIQAGRYHDALIEHWVVDWRWPYKHYLAQRWRIDEMARDGALWRATVTQDSTRSLDTPVGRKFEHDCDYVFGDPDTCKKDLTSLTIDPVTIDTVVEDYFRFRATSSLTGTWNDDDFRHGEVVWKTGNNKGIVSRIEGSIAATRELHLFDPTPFKFQAGDTFTLRAGCGGRLADCIRHNNVLNFGQNPYQIGPKDAYLQRAS